MARQTAHNLLTQSLANLKEVLSELELDTDEDIHLDDAHYLVRMAILQVEKAILDLEAVTRN